jgi:hypothetical protein
LHSSSARSQLSFVLSSTIGTISDLGPEIAARSSFAAIFSATRDYSKAALLDREWSGTNPELARQWLRNAGFTHAGEIADWIESRAV